MKLLLAGIVLVLIVETNANWYNLFNFHYQAAQGSADMLRAYLDMRQANTIGADKYFHAKGNFEAASRGPGGRFAAWGISEGRELAQSLLNNGNSDAAADQEANQWGRDGGDPNIFRPEGLNPKY